MLRTSRSNISHAAPSSLNSPSQEFRRRRKKPLAVAVGFKYAEDQNGRPIVVTPTGSRHAPIDLTGVRQSPPRSASFRSAGPVTGLPSIHSHPDRIARISPGSLNPNNSKW